MACIGTSTCLCGRAGAYMATRDPEAEYPVLVILSGITSQLETKEPRNQGTNKPKSKLDIKKLN